MRTTCSDNGTFSPTAAGRRDQRHHTGHCSPSDDDRLALQLAGQYGQNLALIERRLDVVVDQRGTTMSRSRAHATAANRRAVYSKAFTTGSSAATNWFPAMSRAPFDWRSRRARCSISIRPPRDRVLKRSICASGQCALARQRRMPISARCGATLSCSVRAPPAPARPGSRSHAVRLYERKEVDRIILSRPAVEAGEQLNFLPGDMREEGRSLSASDLRRAL